MNNWDDYFIGMAQYVSTKSKDKSTKVGVVIVGEDHEVLSTGYNGFPRGVNDNIEERHTRPTKYEYTEHAERNAIYNAARQGIRLKDSIMYLNYEPSSICPDCARAIIQSGITEVCGPDIPFPNNGGMNWKDRCIASVIMFAESGVNIVVIEDE